MSCIICLQSCTYLCYISILAIFLAKISKGRTIKQFLFWSIVAPSFYLFAYPVVYGGVGIRLERESSEQGLCCMDNSGWFHNSSKILGAATENGVLSDQLLKSEIAENYSWMCKEQSCGACALSTLTRASNDNQTVQEFIDEYVFLKSDFGSTTIDRTLSKPSCHILVQMWFDVMRSVKGLGMFLSIFSLLAMVLYFITSSDSGSLIIDCLATNGDFDSSPLLKAFWAIMEGVTATALIVAGGKASLMAVQTMAIMSASPMTIAICLMCIAAWRALRVTSGDMDLNGPQFPFQLFEPLFGSPYKRLVPY